MAHKMDHTELLVFLRRTPPPTAVVATTGADGAPHAAPVWFALDDDDNLFFNTAAGSTKGRNLQRDPRVALCIDDSTPPFSFAAIRATVELIDDRSEVRRWAATIGGRYMGESEAERYGERNGVPGELLVKLPLDRVIAIAELAD